MAKISPAGISVIIGKYTALLINKGLINVTGPFMELEKASTQFAIDMSKIDVEEEGKLCAERLKTQANPPTEDIDQIIKSITNSKNN